MKMAGVIFRLLFIAVFFCTAQSYAGEEIRIITDRTPSHLSAIFSKFEADTGIKINAVYVDKGLIARMSSRPTEADLVITKTENILELAKQKGLLQPFSSDRLIQGLKPEFRDAENYYFTTSYRGRVIYYSKDRVKPEELSTYEDLTSPKWKGRVCIRSGYHNYNLSLFAQMAADIGLEKTRAFIKGLHDNLAMAPAGNDRAQVRAIYEGKCDVAIANSYYMGIMLSRDDQRAWGLSAKVFFPNQDEGGTYILRGGAALTTAKRDVPAATKLLEFLIGDYAQEFISHAIYAYSVNDKLPLDEVNRKLGDEQKGIKNGKFKAKFIPVKDIEKYRDDVINILNEVNFDSK